MNFFVPYYVTYFMLNKQIIHLTSAHSRYDTRILLKECYSLAKTGYNVNLVVADGLPDEIIEGVSIYGVEKSVSRIDRMRNATKRVYNKALALDADIYHLHDPELLPIGIKLKKLGKKVIFDAHEDLPKQILGKSYLIKPVRWVLSNVFSCYERWACHKLDSVISATPFIRDKFISMGIPSVDINNFPLLGELSRDPIDWSCKKNMVCYIGGLAHLRGTCDIVKAMESVESSVQLSLGGLFSEPRTYETVKNMAGWTKVNELGWLDREAVHRLLSDSIAGLVTLHPAINYLDALPVKMFEYMAVGLPVIASGFPLWKQIVEGNECGLCVNPLDPIAIANAIDYLAANPDDAEKMGRRGQKAIFDKYNWEIEEKKLLDLYSSIVI